MSLKNPTTSTKGSSSQQCLHKLSTDPIMFDKAKTLLINKAFREGSPHHVNFNGSNQILHLEFSSSDSIFETTPSIKAQHTHVTKPNQAEETRTWISTQSMPIFMVEAKLDPADVEPWI